MAVTQQQLTEAEAALHLLMTGAAKSTVSVSTGVGSRSVTYTRATVPELERYIKWLRRQLAGTPTTRNRVRYVRPFDS